MITDKKRTLKLSVSVADPDFELRRGPGSILLAQPGFFLLFLPKIRGGGGPRARPLDPPLCFIETSTYNVLYL